MPTPCAAVLPISASISRRRSGPSRNAARRRSAAASGAGSFVTRSHQARRAGPIAVASGQ